MMMMKMVMLRSTHQRPASRRTRPGARPSLGCALFYDPQKAPETQSPMLCWLSWQQWAGMVDSLQAVQRHFYFYFIFRIFRMDFPVGFSG